MGRVSFEQPSAISATEMEAGRGEVLTVLPGAAMAPTDNLLLLCAHGQSVLTNADLLHMLSPSVLGDALEVVRSAPAHHTPCSSTNSGSPGPGPGTSPGTSGRSTAGGTAARGLGGKGSCLQLPVTEDSAQDWLLVLRLAHPGLRPKDRPQMDWATTQRVLQHADKYQMGSIEALCGEALAGHLRKGTSPGTSVPLLMETLSYAMRLGLHDLQEACSDVIRLRLQGVESPPGSPQNDAGTAFTRQLHDWLDANAQPATGLRRPAPPDVCCHVASLVLSLYEHAAAKASQPPFAFNSRGTGGLLRGLT